MRATKTRLILLALAFLASVALLGALGSLAAWAGMYAAGGIELFRVIIPFLAVNLPGMASVAVYHYVWGRDTDFYPQWYIKIPAVCAGTLILIVLAAVLLPDTGEGDEIQLLIFIFGRPVLYWLAMCVGDEPQVDPFIAARATSVIGIAHVVCGIAVLLIWGAPIVFDSASQLLAYATVLMFFDPFYLALPLVLYRLGLYDPMGEYDPYPEDYALPIYDDRR